jgi:hypothetical protein
MPVPPPGKLRRNLNAISVFGDGMGSTLRQHGLGRDKRLLRMLTLVDAQSNG